MATVARICETRGSRCLLVGANGAGKTTLLRVIGGKHLIAPGAVSVLGRPAFHDTALAGKVAFLGGPFRWVDSLGGAEVLRRVESYQDQFGVRWTPAPALVDLAKSGKKIHGS